MKNKIYLIKNLFFFLILYFFLSLSSKAENTKKIIVQGNERVADETVIIFSKLQIGEDINQSQLNIALKDIYSTNYFSEVSISKENGIVIIKVKENPIIQSIKIIGIEKDNILETIKDVTMKIEKYPFVESKINDQVNLLKNILKS